MDNVITWQLVANNGTSDGPIFDVSTLSAQPDDPKTIQAGGSFDGSIVVLVSQDGSNFNPLDGATFPLPGNAALTIPCNARYWRVRRFGSATSPGANCHIQIGANIKNSSGGGSLAFPSRIVSNSGNILASDYYIFVVNPPTSFNLTLPQSQPIGKTFIIQDMSDPTNSGLGNNRLELIAGSGESIEGVSSFRLQTRGMTVKVVSRGNGLWRFQGWTTFRFPFRIPAGSPAAMFYTGGGTGLLNQAFPIPYGNDNVRVSRLQITNQDPYADDMAVRAMLVESSFTLAVNLPTPMIATILASQRSGFISANNIIPEGLYLVIRSDTFIYTDLDGYLEYQVPGT